MRQSSSTREGRGHVPTAKTQVSSAASAHPHARVAASGLEREEFEEDEEEGPGSIRSSCWESRITREPAGACYARERGANGLAGSRIYTGTRVDAGEGLRSLERLLS
jgi:hypothetical protein